MRASAAGSEYCHAREIHLDSRLPGLRACAENIENDLLPIGDGHPESSSQFRCCEGLSSLSNTMTSHFCSFANVDDFLRLAGADQITRMILAIRNQFPLDHRKTERVDQLFQFLE